MLRDFLRGRRSRARGQRPRGRRLPSRRAPHPREPVALRRAATHPGRRRRDVPPTTSSSTRSTTSSRPPRPRRSCCVTRAACAARSCSTRSARGTGGGIEIVCAELKRESDKQDFAAAEFRAAGRRISPGALRALVAAFSDDLAELSAACRQLIADAPDEITEAVVARYYGGRVETNAFAVADAAIAGRHGEALVALRHALDSGADPVPMVAAFAMKVRTMAKVSGVRGGGPQVASSLGLAPWQVDRARRDLAGWTDEGLRRRDRGARRDRCRGQGRRARPGVRPRAPGRRHRRPRRASLTARTAVRGWPRRTRRPTPSRFAAHTTKAPHRRAGPSNRSVVRQSAATCFAMRRLAVRGLVLVDDALAGGLVELARRGAEGGGRLLLVAGGDRLAGGADGGLELALDGLVALLRLQVGADALDLRLDVCHVVRLSFMCGYRMCRRR